MQKYKPTQPTIAGPSGTNVLYHEMPPDIKLKNFICCYWELKTRGRLTEQFIYPVVADGCMDVFFSLGKPSETYVMGFCNSYTEFELENVFHYIGIRFLPTIFPQFFNVNASHLTNRCERLSVIDAGAANFISNHLDACKNLADAASIFNLYFFDRLSRHSLDFDTRLYEAISIIFNKCGAVNVEIDLDTGISTRHLRRLFQFYVGDSAKVFSKVVRFQNIIRTKLSTESLNKNHSFFDYGYYDQAHFIKEFKKFYGKTPGQAFL